MDALNITYAQERITPFWKKLPFFFLFPFRTGPLIALVILIGASVLAGLVMGPFGLLFKGTLVYLGLRYGFNVLDLFAKGRFEGESVDYTLWGPERRPAKLGLVIVLFIVLAATLGNLQVAPAWPRMLRRRPGSLPAISKSTRPSCFAASLRTIPTIRWLPR